MNSTSVLVAGPGAEQLRASMACRAPIRNEGDYEVALAAIDRLMDAEPGTPEGDEVEVLATLVEAYEAARWPVEAPDSVSAIEL